jgi:hypothetical protein
VNASGIAQIGASIQPVAELTNHLFAARTKPVQPISFLASTFCDTTLIIFYN